MARAQFLARPLTRKIISDALEGATRISTQHNTVPIRLA
jgi:hypothetical protein